MNLKPTIVVCQKYFKRVKNKTLFLWDFFVFAHLQRVVFNSAKSEVNT